MKVVYLDNNATSPLAPAAREAMVRCLDEVFGNPSSIHAAGEAARAAVDDARARVAGVLGGRASEITWTSCATESINWALRGVAEARPDARRIVTSAVEHAATLDVCERMERAGWEVVRLPVEPDGTLPVARVAEALATPTTILSLLHANNETGVLFDIDAIGTVAREHGVPFHVDAVQSVGKGLTGLADRSIDLVSMSGHKFGAPKGVGALWSRRGTRLRPLVWGGHHEQGRRGGTENVPGLVGMAAALEASQAAWSKHETGLAALRDHLEASLLDRVPDLIVAGAGAPRIANTLDVCFPHVEGAAVVLTLSARGIYCSSGSACTAAQEGPSHVLAAMGVDGDHIHGAVRLSLSTSTTRDEIDHAIEQVVAAYTHVARVNTHS